MDRVMIIETKDPQRPILLTPRTRCGHQICWSQTNVWELGTTFLNLNTFGQRPPKLLLTQMSTKSRFLFARGCKWITSFYFLPNIHKTVGYWLQGWETPSSYLTKAAL